MTTTDCCHVPITPCPRCGTKFCYDCNRIITEPETSGRDRGLLDPLRTIDYSMKWQPHTRQWLALASDDKTLGRGDGVTQEEALLDLLAGLMVTIGTLHQRLNDKRRDVPSPQYTVKTPATHPEEFHPDGYPYPYEEMGG